MKSPLLLLISRFNGPASGYFCLLDLFAMKYSSGTSTGAVNMEIKLPAISAMASP